MILTGNEISAQVAAGTITIDPFEPERLNPNSCDLRLGDTLLEYTELELDPFRKNPVRELRVPPTGLRLRGGGFYLGASEERVGSTRFAPIIHAKSGIARLGLFVHVTADLIDIGFVGNITFQLHPILNLTIYPQMLVAQVSFWQAQGEIRLYDGKYQGSFGPQSSKSYLDRSSEMAPHDTATGSPVRATNGGEDATA